MAEKKKVDRVRKKIKPVTETAPHRVTAEKL